MSEYAWMYLNKHAKILNMPKFWIWQGFELASVQCCNSQLLPIFGFWPPIFIMQWSLWLVVFPRNLLIIILRNSRTQVFFKAGVIRNFAIFTGKHLCWSLFLMCRPYSLQLYFNLVPKETSTKVIPVKIVMFLRTAFLWNTSDGGFCQFEKVTIHGWASGDLLFLIRNKICGMVSTKIFLGSGQSMLFTHY